MISLSNEQMKARDAIKDWYFNSKKPTFFLSGYAGSGKTVCIKNFVSDLNLNPDSESDVLYGSYTGKATLVLKRKGLRQATTIHRMIYIPMEDDQGRVIFKLNNDSILRATKLVILDECSMINDIIAQDLLRFGKKILVIGDPGQLPPIEGSGYFTKNEPDFFLTEIHRQAAENPIIRLATMARNGEKIPFGSFSEKVKHVKPKDVIYDELLNADQIITGTNKTRIELNRDIKSKYKMGKYPIRSGAKLICLKNDHKKGLLNGALFTTTSNECHWSPGKFFTQTLIDDEGRKYPKLDIYVGWFENYDEKVPANIKENELRIKNDLRKKNLCEFDYGYAITVHKSQGSQWDNVFIYDDDCKWGGDKEIRKRWLYTGITRAAEELILMSEK